jgi:hypothetical protein
MAWVLRRICLGLFVLILGTLWPSRVAASSILYSNLAVTNQIGLASRPAGPGIEIEAADDFVLTSPASITGVSFIGLVPSGAIINFAAMDVEFYRVFPLDSNTVRTPNVTTRANSPSDIEFADHAFTLADPVSITVVQPTFTVSNSVLNGINPAPNQLTGGEGSVTGQEVLFTFNFANPVFLPADHYFFVPQVPLASAGNFLWLSASRPIVPPGTPFPGGSTDLQAWIRNADLDPDWSRVGTDIVGGGSTFNMAFEIRGDAVTAVPEPATLFLLGSGLMLARRAISSRCVSTRTHAAPWPVHSPAFGRAIWQRPGPRGGWNQT